MKEGMTDQSATHVPADEGRSFWLFTDLYTFKAVGEDTAEAFALMELTAYTQFAPPPHIHHRQDESYYILEGEFEFTADSRTFTAGPGSFVYLPKGSLHLHRNAGDTPARALVLQTPAGVEKLFEEGAKPATDTSSVPPLPEMPEIQRAVETAQKYGIEVPPPPGQ
jgi:mannose-6-phosphate isomerase-like protein (cupin superfamily)